MKRIGTIAFLVVISVVVTGLTFLSSGPAAWATPSQNPEAQTVPTPVPTAIPVTPAPTPTPAPSGGVGTVTNASGGSVTTDDGKTIVTVPAGAVAQASVDITLTPKTGADVPAPPPGTAVLGAFDIKAFVSGAPQASYSFNQAITICTVVTQAHIDKVKGDVAKLVIMRFVEDTKAWVSLPTTVDPPVAGGKACATVKGLSSFALAATGQVATPTAGGPGAGDTYLSGPTTWWMGLAVLGLFLVLFGGLALRRNINKRDV